MLVNPTTGTILFYKAKRQDLLTLQVNRYCLLAFHGSIVDIRARVINPYSGEVFGINHGDQSVFFQFEIIINDLVSSLVHLNTSVMDSG